ncbi:MAG: hypothetical protein ACQCN3_02480 [Candidatus Bathyarchaeia archaeon]|jgi:hypothetical protein
MGWKISDFGIAMFAVLGVIPSLIIIGVLFAVFGVVLFVTGLVSAMIYFLAGIGVLWGLSAFGVFKSWKGWLLAPLILLGMTSWGYMTDHVAGLSMMSPAQFISLNPTITIAQGSLTGDAVTFIMTPAVFGAFLFVTGLIIGMLTWKFGKLKK